MSQYDHWHPVALAKALGRSPLSVRLLDREIVLFRTAGGSIGALADVCVHRRARLSCGQVAGDCLVCPYHGWRFSVDGAAESPGTPKLRAVAEHYEAREAEGLIWLKPAGCRASFPAFPVEGFQFVAVSQHQADAPLELVLDNFSEIEHTPMTHVLFGYDIRRMTEVTVSASTHGDVLRCATAGPHQPLPIWLRLFMGVGRDVEFRDEFEVRFSPVHMRIDHTLTDGRTGRRGRIQYRVFAFFTPLNAQQTSVFIVLYLQSRYPGPRGGARLFGPWLRWFARREIEHDCRALRNLADKRTDLQGLKLSRFDRLLHLNRRHIERIYRGQVGSDSARVESEWFGPEASPSATAAT